ncbi:MAG: CoA-binding protein [Candidatus Dadabacteria bacterium]|nr:CoA-binding protein [Candidatus Dadabacteria bacterium]NIS07943.1 CoA-binding protein [Candidatus Dadabacteria bacterium]NIY21527.1 CoA-binding protein [Candidatus Dadabacteria bacterium]
MTDDIKGLRRILKECKTIAMVGLSQKWNRPSNYAAKYLLLHGYEVIPVTPTYEEVLGQKCYGSILDIPKKVDVVDCFRKPEEIPKLAKDAVKIGAKVLWMQLGIVNEEARKIAEDAGLEVVMNRCMKIEHGRIFGGISFLGVNTSVITSKKQ